MPSQAPLIAVEKRADAATANRKGFKSIYFCDESINSTVRNLRKHLDYRCPRSTRKSIMREAVRMVSNRPWLDKYYFIVTNISSYKPEHRAGALTYFASIVASPFFRLKYIDHIQRMTSIDDEHSHFSLLLLSTFIESRREMSMKMHMNRERGEEHAVMKALRITNANVDAVCELVSVIKSKCNGSSESFVYRLADFFSKRNFVLSIVPTIVQDISGLEEHQIPRYLEKINRQNV